MSDLYPLVVLTKIDKLCTTTEEDTTKVFSSRAVDEKVSFYLYKATKHHAIITMLTDSRDQRGAGDLTQHDPSYQELHHTGGMPRCHGHPHTEGSEADTEGIPGLSGGQNSHEK